MRDIIDEKDQEIEYTRSVNIVKSVENNFSVGKKLNFMKVEWRAIFAKLCLPIKCVPTFSRNTLMSMYTKNNSDPLDPAPMKTGNAGEGNDSPLGVDSISVFQKYSHINKVICLGECNLNLHGRLPSKHSQRTFKSSDDAYNIFYEQEITKRENEIFELRY